MSAAAAAAPLPEVGATMLLSVILLEVVVGVVLSKSYSQNGLESESRSCMAVIDCCKALGVNHSFGKQRCKKGTHELKCAKRFTQLGISCPQRIWVSDPEK